MLTCELSQHVSYCFFSQIMLALTFAVKCPATSTHFNPPLHRFEKQTFRPSTRERTSDTLAKRTRIKWIRTVHAQCTMVHTQQRLKEPSLSIPVGYPIPQVTSSLYQVTKNLSWSWTSGIESKPCESKRAKRRRASRPSSSRCRSRTSRRTMAGNGGLGGFGGTHVLCLPGALCVVTIRKAGVAGNLENCGRWVFREQAA